MQAGQVIVPSAFRIMEQPAGSDALVAVLLTTEVTLKPRPEDEPMRWVIRWVSHTRGGGHALPVVSSYSPLTEAMPSQMTYR